ncbi:hypothetical protein Vafri_16024 [Volvox africanus]|uniref:Uncharacterized protein n=1 Tax=Volvox africanus TaxID=51714 RepID=A0A8J4BH76_9CHLO|nr:hypothetical protein Vafri_16024 [Volvox africanus]
MPPPGVEEAGVPAPGEGPPLAPKPPVPQVLSRLRSRRPPWLLLLPTSASKPPPPPRQLLLFRGEPLMSSGGGTFAALVAAAIGSAATASGCSAELEDASGPVVVPVPVRVG